MAGVYETVFDTVAENMSAAGQAFPYNRETFLADVETSPQEIDVSRFLNLPNDKFFQAVYVTVFRRLPNEKTEKFWLGKTGEPVEVYQKKLLKAVNKSSVVAINHIRFINNPYFEQKRGLMYHVWGLVYGLTDKSFLRQFGKKLPMPIQRIIRRIFL